ncbi:MAG: hypothetical protein A2358_00430 [Candidatus Staskawiczbacteria bacterium RIFOXYB1_FULL_37_44]|uniref:Uncharacterized protein n=1 Tax=Candidatus Staskawiczbacteria bacterium RIFOXYB1_FULL_37_44 TaxID=1802223 RepID=A0A1G2IX60_9BACT|nr:MAG: hypothetical protein A2358_00430 [Candidatus Staskawiczbacteria bacterium RIFOXYB1_FULL_37_44]OGZ83480.1 MAG: hypothetical protein A2416_04095 [Candidatus Staskawiczbacteria bacterium RIFOXYC1_FULL_37_52]OGZ89645.1 MAG: hypothetical protein A2444_04255 [Candidatus Staskawiczbacteria bacterium RIFOXYC2_FULL_37_19]
MRFLFNKFWKIFFIISIILLLFVVIVTFTFLYFQNKKSETRINTNTNKTISYFNIKSFGNLIWGSEIISGPGDYTFAPYLEIPQVKFYVTIIQNEQWCSNEDCGFDGAIIQTLGGWLQMESLQGYPDLTDEIGFDFPDDQGIKSIIIVGDKDGKIVGIYLNKDYKDVLSILKKNHFDLANFDFLNGVNEFGRLKIGGYAPLKPGDEIKNLFSDKARTIENKIPNDKKFYLYGIEKRKNMVLGIDKLEKISEEERKNRGGYVCFLGGCRYPEPDDSHDFLFADIDELGGWFLASDNDNIKMIELFGLNPEDVLSGKSSIIVLTDAKGVIVALHPNKTMSDAITILSQHPNLVDMKKMYQ